MVVIPIITIIYRTLVIKKIFLVMTVFMDIVSANRINPLLNCFKCIGDFNFSFQFHLLYKLLDCDGQIVINR